MAPSRRAWELVLALLIVVVARTALAEEPQDGALPWELGPRVGPLPWEGLEDDLDGLLRVQARGERGLVSPRAGEGRSWGWRRRRRRAAGVHLPGTPTPQHPSPPPSQARDGAVSLVVFNEGFYAVTLNCLVSMIRFGRLRNLVVTAAGRGSLMRCKRLRLPCYDGAHLLKEHGSRAAEGDAARNSPEWFQLVWTKTLIAHAAITRGYNVLFAGARAAPAGGLLGVSDRGFRGAGMELLRVGGGGAARIQRPAGRRGFSGWRGSCSLLQAAPARKLAASGVADHTRPAAPCDLHTVRR
jgi:hypothetical protein